MKYLVIILLALMSAHISAQEATPSVVIQNGERIYGDNIASKRSVNNDEVIIYTHHNQEDCAQLTKYLRSNNIDHKEYKVYYTSGNTEQYKALLAKHRLQISDVRLPLVKMNEEIYHSINDIVTFIKEKFPVE